MNPRDQEPAVPETGRHDLLADWPTEESLAEPTGAAARVTAARQSAARATPAANPAGEPMPAATPPLEAPAAATPSATLAAPASAPPIEAPELAPAEAPELAPAAWLASAEGLVAPAAGVPSSTAQAAGRGEELDVAATRVGPRAQLPADDWDWESAPPEAEGPPLPPVAPRIAPRGAPPPGMDAPADDPYGRQAMLSPEAPRAGGPPGSWAPPKGGRYDQEALYGAYDEAPRRGFPWGRLFVSFLLGLLLTGIIAGGAIYAYDQQYADRILPNVRVGSVDVSGLTREAARQRLADAYRSYSEGTVRVTLAGATTEIPYADVDRRADVDRMVDAAMRVGRATSPVDRLLGELRTVTKGAAVAPAVVLDGAKLEQNVRDIARAAEWKPVDASAVVTPTGFATTPAKAGQTVDEGTAAADAARQLAAIDAPAGIDITLTATPIPPAVSDQSAQAAVRQAALMNNDVVLQAGEDSWVIPAAIVHQWLSFAVINNRARIVIDTKAVLAQLKPLSKKIDRPVVNATVKLSGARIVFDKPSVEGRTFNASKTTTAVVNGLRNRALGNLAVDAPIPPVLAIVKPALTTDEAKKAIPLMKEISSWTTNYQPSERNGNGANIRIPTSTINGHVVAPGETFSFWKAVGPVTKELGYTQGGAIIDGHTEPQGALGGGICSCSTTLFNAALRAGFTMGARLNHFYYINRYPLGLDATVFINAAGQAQDMTWTNDSDYPVIIQGINGKTYVKFVLYSVPNGRTTTFTDPIVKNYTKATTVTKVDKTIPTGTRKQIEYATDGQDVTVTRIVKDKTGAVLHKDTYYSHYATITGIILTNP